MMVDMRNPFSEFEERRESVEQAVVNAAKVRKAARRRKRKPHDDCPTTPDPDIPYWVPSGDGWKNTPEEIRRAIPQVLAPAYRQFVLEASGELERSIGLTLVHLIWLEVCCQVHLAVAAADPTSLAAVLNNPEAMIARHLELVMAKCQAAELLVKMRLVSQSLQRPSSALPILPPPSSTGILPVPGSLGILPVPDLIPAPETMKLETDGSVDQHP